MSALRCWFVSKTTRATTIAKEVMPQYLLCKEEESRDCPMEAMVIGGSSRLTRFRRRRGMLLAGVEVAIFIVVGDIDIGWGYLPPLSPVSCLCVLIKEKANISSQYILKIHHSRSIHYKSYM